MKKLSLEILNDLQLSNGIIDRFLMSVVTKRIHDAIFNSDVTELIYSESEDLKDYHEVLVHDTYKDTPAFNFETEKENVVVEIKKKIVEYVSNEYSKEGYTSVVVDVVVLYADGAYHIEPNTIYCIKNEYLDKGIEKIVYDCDNKVYGLTSSKNKVFLSKEDIKDIGILV